ncbi:MAG: metallophosphoesterase, partial [Bacteroidota bacterium]
MSTIQPRVAFISDLHLGGFCTLGPNHEDYRNGIIKILRYLKEQKPTHLVMLGDMFDSWTFPRKMLPLAYEHQIKHPDNIGIIAALQEFAADPDVTLAYTPGNHDFDLEPDLFRTYFRGTQVADNFTLGFVWGEHGHRFDLFNATDPENRDPAKGHRPMGYYITRIHTQDIRGGGVRELPVFENSSAYIASKLREALAELSPGKNERGMSGWTVATLVLSYVMKDAGIGYEDTILMPNGSEITVQQV